MNTYARFPITLERGKGVRVWDSSGRDYLDFVAGIAVCALGHAPQVLIEAVSKQLATLHHTSNLYYTIPQGELARWLVDHSCADRVFFCNSGGEANEAAFKLARKYAHTVLDIHEPVIVCAVNSFHGRTLAGISATGQAKYQKDFGPLVPGFEHVPYNDFASLQTKVTSLDSEKRRVAAVLLEPIQGEGGVTPAAAGYLQDVRTFCSERGILFMLDEVQTGMGRTGRLWCYEHSSIEPDIITAAKGLGGGIPIGAMLAKEFCSVFGPGEHATTFGGNPLACAAALAVCRTIGEKRFLEQVIQSGETLRRSLTSVADEFRELFAGVRGVGLMQGLIIREDSGLQAASLVRAAMDYGLLLVSAGTKVVRFVPPLTVTTADIDEAMIRLTKGCSDLRAHSHES